MQTDNNRKKFRMVQL